LLIVLYNILLGLMFILIGALFFLHIFYQTPDLRENLSFSFEEFPPIKANTLGKKEESEINS
jgi:hypothetical protein